MPTQGVRLGIMEMRRQRAASLQNLGSQLSLGRARHGVNDDRHVTDTAKGRRTDLGGFNHADAVNV
jgi:hypothetical protein